MNTAECILSQFLVEEFQFLTVHLKLTGENHRNQKISLVIRSVAAM